MATETHETKPSPVLIEKGLVDWQIVQQDANGVATVTLAGAWSTIMRRKKPEVRVRVAREGGFAAIGCAFDHVLARTTVDRSVTGEGAGKSGRWKVTLEGIPCGGPYRIETTVGNAGDAIEWRRTGDAVHFFGVGDVWLIAGQSNAEGYGRDPVDDPPEIGIHQFDGRGWRLAAHDRNHSPWLAFAKQLRQELGYPIGLILTAVGGSAVSEWDPGQKGALFATMKERVQDAGPQIKGCAWYQGESDVGDREHPKYKVRFARFVNGLRRVAKQSDLPIITVQLNRVLGARTDGRGWEAIREIQRQLSHELDGVFVIPILEAGLCDGIHISSLGNLLVAQRAATTALGGVYGKDIHYRHPECVAANKVSGTVVDLRFDHVITRLDYESPAGNGFAFSVRDADGEVAVVGVTLPRTDTVRVELGRPLTGEATVIGAPGCCPPSIVPRDINGYRGMLAFTRDVQAR